jgi:hypothetical protein
MNFRDLSEKDLNSTVWRYTPFSKFISMLTYQALWFSKLNILQDQYEGMMPLVTKEMMTREHQKYKEFIDPAHHWQFDAMAGRNEQDGRELIVANCWFFGETESERMWKEYVGTPEGVAIKSTPKRLSENVLMLGDNNMNHMGRVRYVDHATHQMIPYEANQAIERAFIKDKQFEHEQELRLATMSLKRGYCVRMDGVPYTKEEVEGKNMNNFENPGLYIGIKIDTLFTEVVVAKSAPDWLFSLVKRIIDLYGINVPVVRSIVY